MTEKATFTRACMSCGVEFETDTETYVLCPDCVKLSKQDDDKETTTHWYPLFSGNY